MKNLIFQAVLSIVTLSTAFSQCTSLYSFAANFETVNFINQSNIPNAHYFWNFGDGTGSNFKNPIHKFPETGNYLVTLFAQDTISNCSSFYEYWLNLTKFSNDSCQPGGITDTILFNNNSYFLKMSCTSAKCNAYQIGIDGGPAQNFALGYSIWLGGGWQHARFLSRIKYYTYDTINGVVNHRAIYKTRPFRHTSAKNYDDCSANFEFHTVSQNTSGQRIQFKAMNRTATNYKWEIIGFGNPIYSNNDTISQFYPYNYNNLWTVGLNTQGYTGCKDTLYQNILIQNITQTYTEIKENSADKFSFHVYPNPTPDKIIISTAVELDKITIVNCMGQEVYVLRKPQLRQEIDVSYLPAGIYFVEAENKQSRSAMKFIKQ